MAPIQDGISTSSSFPVRPLHCVTASTTSTLPSRSLSTFTHVDGRPSSLAPAPSAITSAITPSTATPVSHPAVNARPFARARALTSMSTTTEIGTGFAAMATASGSIWPIASPMRD